MTTEHRPYVHVCHHALHATDRPAKQRLSPKKAMQEPTNVFDKEQPYHDTMIQSYHSVSKISLISTPHESSLRHDERAHNHNSTATNRSKQTVVHNTDKR